MRYVVNGRFPSGSRCVVRFGDVSDRRPLRGGPSVAAALRSGSSVAAALRGGSLFSPFRTAPVRRPPFRCAGGLRCAPFVPASRFRAARSVPDRSRPPPAVPLRPRSVRLSLQPVPDRSRPPPVFPAASWFAVRPADVRALRPAAWERSDPAPAALFRTAYSPPQTLPPCCPLRACRPRAVTSSSCRARPRRASP